MYKALIFLWVPLCVALLGSPAAGWAQFGITPTDSLVGTFPVDSITRIYQIDFPNTSGDSLGLSWRRVDGGWTDGWDVNLCDLGECYTGVPADADMMPMGPEGAGYLKLIVNALETEGNCFLHFWVWPTGNQDALVHVYFDLRNDPMASNVVLPVRNPQTARLHPVPAHCGQPVFLRGATGDRTVSHVVQLFDVQGALLRCTTEWQDGELRMETGHLSPGMYLLKFDEKLPPLRLIME